MKAAVLYGNEDLRYADYPDPEVKPGYVKIKVAVTGICGSDVPRVLYNGAHGYPIVLGHEFSGVIAEVGDNVTTCKVGDRVSGVPLVPCMKCDDCQKGWYSLCRHYSFIGSRQQGSFAEYIVVPERNVVPFADNVSFIQGALFEPATVALHGLLQNRFQGGGTVAVLGGGTIGLLTMQFARIFGASKTVVFDISDDRLELAVEMGATAGINTMKDNVAARIAELTDGKGFNYVFETAGQPATMQLAFRAASNKASICFIGTPHKDLTFDPATWELMNRKEFYLTGSWMSYSAPFPGKEWSLVAHYFATGQLKINDKMIQECAALDRAAELFSLYKTPGAVNGKLMLISNEDLL